MDKLRDHLPAFLAGAVAGLAIAKAVALCSFHESKKTTPLRKAFVMSVDAGKEIEYERRHRPIWPELEAVLLEHGVHTYSIFLLQETRQLFAYAEIQDEAKWASIAATEVCQRWWQHMGDVMPSNADGSPVAVGLREVFHIEAN